MTGTLWKRCNKWTDQPTEGRTHRDVLRAARSQLKMSMTQVMACCLIAPSHYLQHGWLANNMVLWLSTKANFTESAQKNIERHTAHTIVSWPNPKQWVIVHTSDLMMIIRQSMYILSIITKEMGKLKTHSPTYCIMDNWENMLNLTHTLDKLYLTGIL